MPTKKTKAARPVLRRKPKKRTSTRPTNSCHAREREHPEYHDRPRLARIAPLSTAYRLAPPLRRVPPDRGRKGFRLPSLRTVRAVLPHTALQSLVSSSGVPRAFVSCFEGEQPAIREKDIWPAAVVLESATAAGT